MNKRQDLGKKKKWESIFAYGKGLSSKYKFTENDVNLEIKKLNEKIAQNPININNGNQIRKTNRST